MSNVFVRACGLCLATPQGRVLLEPSDLMLDNRPAALVGANGSGKSWLCRLLAGVEKPDQGSLQLPPSRVLVDSTGRLVASGCDDPAPGCLARWQGWFETTGSCGPFRAGASGGERQRQVLASAFAYGPDFLILDEPGAHLDRDGRRRLLEALRQFGGLLLVVSHQPEILGIAERVIELSQAKLHDYGLGLAGFIAERAREQSAAERDLKQARRALERSQSRAQRARERSEGRAAVGRRERRAGSQGAMHFDFQTGRAEAGQGRRLRADQARQSRAQAVLQASRDRLRVDADFDLRLPGELLPAVRSVLRAEGLGLRVPGRCLVRKLDFDMRGSARCAVIGPNGSGKSLLLECLAGLRVPDTGHCQRAELRFVHFAQAGGSAALEGNVLAAFSRAQPALTPDSQRQRLAWFGFTGEQITQPASSLSSGERVRLELCCALAGPSVPSLMLLDEPDNHLDLTSLAIVTRALQQYRGALVLVSHSDALLEAVGVTERLYLDGHGGAVFVP